MLRFQGITNKILFLWLASVILTLATVGGLFAFSLERYDRAAANERIGETASQLRQALLTKTSRATSLVQNLAADQTIISAMNLVSKYQDIQNYDALTYDGEKKKIASRLEDRTGVSRHHYAAIFDRDRNLTAFYGRDGGQQFFGIVTYENGAPVILLNERQENVYRKLTYLPEEVARIQLAGNEDTIVERFLSVSDGIMVVSQVPIQRTRLGGRIDDLGFLLFVDMFDEETVKDLSRGGVVNIGYELIGDDFEVAYGLVPSGVPASMKGDPLLADLESADLISVGNNYAIPLHLELDDGVTARFVLSTEKEGQKTELSALTDSILVGMGVFLLLFLPIGYWIINRFVRKPLGVLVSGVEAIQKADYEHQIDVPGRDELALLAQSFNKMSKTIRSREDALGRARDTLEIQVHERTLDLSRQKSLFESVFQGVPDALFVVSAEREIIMCNAAVHETFGYDPSEVIGQKTAFLYESQEEFERQGQMRYNVKAEDMGQPYTVNYARKNGEVFPGETVAAVVRDEDGNALGFLGIIRDVSERNLLQAQLIQSSKMATLGEMSTGVAHELNQPLNIIRMAAENIKRRLDKGKLEPDYLSDKIDRVQKQTGRASAIIDHMRAFGRKASTDMVDLDMRAAVTGTLDMIGEQLALANIDVALDLPEDPVMARGQSVQLEQIVLNLVGNARDVLAEKEGGPKQVIISVSSSPKSGRACLTVRDTGGGIPDNVIGHVFEPFFTTKEVGKGTGLGLSIVYGLVKDMDGTIDVHNAHGGAEFNVFLPAGEKA